MEGAKLGMWGGAVDGVPMAGGREGANGRDVGSEVGNVSEQRRGGDGRDVGSEEGNVSEQRRRGDGRNVEER